VERWVANYGRAAAISVCEYDQKEPQIGSIFAFFDANFARLDDGSRLVAEVAGASVPGAKKIWDCCAAPGGKTVVLAARNPEAEVLATDVSPRRLKALAERVKREAPDARIRTAEADAAALPESEGLFDLILCDVPCSGTGTLARNPEIRHHLRPSDLARQAERQRALLAGSLKRLAPGGRLVYSTCSLEPEENEQVVEAVLAESPAVQRVGLEPVVTELQRSGIVDPAANLDGVLRNGTLRTLPGVGFQGDGFFAAMFTKS